MKKLFLSLMLLATVGSAMAQTPEEKAAQKAAEAAEKAANKEASSLLSKGVKLRDEINLLMQANQTELAKGKNANQETIAKNNTTILDKAKESESLINKAFATNRIPEKKMFEGYSALKFVSSQILNNELKKAQDKQPFDTLAFETSYKSAAKAMHVVLTKGNRKNEMQKPEILSSELQLPNTIRYYAYDCIFAIQNKDLKKACEAYDAYVNFANTYPEVANSDVVKNPDTPSSMLAFNIYYTAYTMKDYATMEKFYDQAVQYNDDESHNFVVQSRPQMYLAQGDSAKWEDCMTQMIKNDPTSESAETAIWNLCANYAKSGDNTKLGSFIDECLTANPESKSANIWKGRFLKTNKKNTEAITYLEKAGQIDPSEAMVQELIGECYYDIAIENNKGIDKKISAHKYTNQAAANKDIEAKVKSNMRKAVGYFQNAINACEADSDIAKYSQNYIDEINKLLKK